MTLENYLAIGLIGLLFAVLVFVVVRLVYDWCDTRKLEAQLKYRQEGYERGYLAGRVDGRAEVQAEWTEAEEKRQAEEEKHKKEEEAEAKKHGVWYGNRYYMHDPIEIVHSSAETIDLFAEQGFTEEELEHIGEDKARVLLTYKVLEQAAQYVETDAVFSPAVMGRLLRVRLKIVRPRR